MNEKREKLSTFVWFVIAIGYVLSFQYLAIGGYEWFIFRNATLNGGLADKVANPPYIFALLYPLALLPVRWGIFIYCFMAIVAIYVTHRLIGVNKWLLLLSYPVIRNLFFTQLDILTMLGVALGWWSIRKQKPLWLGVSITLLGIKPHVTGVLAIVYLLWGWHWRAILVPLMVLLLSFVVYGFWLYAWLVHTLSQSVGPDPFFDGGIGFFPYGILFWIPVLIGISLQIYSRQQVAYSIIAATILSMPYVGSYSVMAFLGLPISFWTYLFILPPFWVDLRLILALIIIGPLVLYSIRRILHHFNYDLLSFANGWENLKL